MKTRNHSFLLATLLTCALLLGCATPPPLKGHSDLLDFLADGKTSREEVALKLGLPSGKFERENILTYRLGFEPKNRGYYVVEREAQPSGWPTWLLAKYSLVLVFDEAGVLRRHSLVEVN